MIFKDGRIGYVNSVCTCEKCKKRGCYELFINNLNDEYLDCIKANELEDIAAVGYSIQEVVRKLKEHHDLEVGKIKTIKRFYEDMVDYYATHIQENNIVKQ